MTLHINYGPETEEIRRDPDGERWCFVCRKYRQFFYTVTAPVDPESYYGPNPSIRCERGHIDGDLFPGRFREWGEQ